MSKITQALIIKVVSDKNGCKAMDLAANREIALSVDKDDSLMSNVDILVTEGKLIEIEYVLPQSERVKSFLLPANTDVKIRKGK